MAELSKLGRYELRRVLGRGAMGVVYEGFDPNLSRRVAVKTILKSAALDEETERAYSARFVREAQAVGRLNHPNIVQVHDFGEQDEIAYLVMEFIEGRELRGFFGAKEAFAPPETVRIMSELLDALEFAHERGVIHRDIKPANVMLDAQRRVKLTDFGVARVQDSDRSAAGTMVGTPAFMSPEQISGGRIDRRTDIFSAGVVLYQLLTGEQPFKGEGAWTVAKQIMESDPPLPSTVVQSISPAFDAVVNKALAKNPVQRFARASEFAAALRALAAPAQASVPPATPAIAAPKAKATEAEVEFWRAIQASADPAEFEFYLEQFPDGTYAQLARHKIAKLKEPLEAARKEAGEKARKEAEEQAKKEAQEKARREAEERAKQEAEAKARREAAERARKAAEEKARQEAEARRRQEEEKKREEEAKKRQEEARKRQEEEKKRQAEALARLKAQEAARAKAAAVDEDATVAMRAPAPPAPKKSFFVPILLAVLVVVGGAVAYLVIKRAPAPVPVAEKPAPPKVEAPVIDVEKIKRETEERLRREYAEKLAAEQAAAAKAAAEKALAEKQAAAKAAAEKAAAEKLAAEKAAAEKAAAAKLAAADRAAAEKAAAEKAAAEKAAAEKAAAEKAAAEKALAEKAAAEKAAAQKAAAEKLAAAKRSGPGVGDRWYYRGRDADLRDKRFELVAETVAVNPPGYTEALRQSPGGSRRVGFSEASLVGLSPGLGIFSALMTSRTPGSGQSWPQLQIVQFAPCQDANFDCAGSGSVASRERVSVAAGSFDSVRVVLTVTLAGLGFYGRASGTLEYWYAPELGRVVKYRSRFIGTNRSTTYVQNLDLELAGYQRSGEAPIGEKIPQ